MFRNINLPLYLFVELGHTVVVKFKSITPVIWMGDLCSSLCNLYKMSICIME